MARGARRPAVPAHRAGPGRRPREADRVWTRIAVAPDSGCKGAFDALLSRALAPSAASACCAPPTPTPRRAMSPPSACCSPRRTRPAWRPSPAASTGSAWTAAAT
ncbi:hypothetical protein ACFQV4_17890 [Streptomyces thermocarboxydus]